MSHEGEKYSNDCAVKKVYWKITDRVLPKVKAWPLGQIFNLNAKQLYLYENYWTDFNLYTRQKAKSWKNHLIV